MKKTFALIDFLVIFGMGVLFVWIVLAFIFKTDFTKKETPYQNFVESPVQINQIAPNVFEITGGNNASRRGKMNEFVSSKQLEVVNFSPESKNESISFIVKPK
jgi:hypothetical protein